MKRRRTRIVIADAQPLNRAGTRLLIETQPDFVVVGETATIAATLRQCARLAPRVLILDARMSDLDGVDAIPRLAAAAPELRILAIAERGEDRCLVLNPTRGRTAAVECPAIVDCLQLAVTRGAHGAIRRSAEPNDLFGAVRALADGHSWYESGTSRRLAARAGGDAAPPLTARELEVAGLIADGKSNGDIARILDIGEATVKKHLTHIFTKLGLQDRLQVGLHVARNPLLLDRRRSPGRSEGR